MPSYKLKRGMGKARESAREIQPEFSQIANDVAVETEGVLNLMYHSKEDEALVHLMVAGLRERLHGYDEQTRYRAMVHIFTELCSCWIHGQRLNDVITRITAYLIEAKLTFRRFE